MKLDPLSSRLWTGAGQNGLVSLMYHSITPGKAKPAWKWALSFRDFCEQLNLLEDAGWTTVGSNTLTETVQLPEKSVLITFDDGYADNYPAFEELAKRKMLASWFVVTRDIAKTAAWSDKGAPQLKLLTNQQLQEMHDTGMTIGSHTHTHCRLTQAGPEQVISELKMSQNLLSDILSAPVSHFAYPYGLYNTEVRESVKESGYKTAFTTRTGFGFVGNNPLEIRRVAVMANDTPSSFARKMAFAANDVSWPKMASYCSDRLIQKIRS